MSSHEDDNNGFEEESEQYQRRYLYAIDDVQRKIKLGNRDVTINKGRFNQNQYSSSQQNRRKKKERLTSFHDMQENSQQLVMSSLTEGDISQSSV